MADGAVMKAAIVSVTFMLVIGTIVIVYRYFKHKERLNAHTKNCINGTFNSPDVK